MMDTHTKENRMTLQDTNRSMLDLIVEARTLVASASIGGWPNMTAVLDEIERRCLAADIALNDLNAHLNGLYGAVLIADAVEHAEPRAMNLASCEAWLADLHTLGETAPP